MTQVLPVQYFPGEHLLKMRQPGVGLFFILEGSCEAWVPDATNSEVRDVVRVLSPGDLFGEVSLLNNSSATCNISAASIVTCQVMHTFAVEPHLEQLCIHSCIPSFVLTLTFLLHFLSHLHLLPT